MDNRAAWIKTPKQYPLEVSSAPAVSAGAGEVVIKNAFLAINPVDWKTQLYGPAYQTYPGILGRDVAGEVVEVGEGVTTIKKGMRVIAHALSRASGDTKHGAFQLYTVAHEITTAPIPDSLSFAEAVVLPLSISTAAAGLYQKEYLALPYPSLTPVRNGRTILVWGGSSSVGSTAIQLAIASGLDVAATASKRNQAYVQSLGAKWIFDYAESDVVSAIVRVLEGSTFVGAYDAISEPETLKAVGEIVQKLGGGKIATVLGTPSGLPKGVEGRGVMATSIAFEAKEVGDAVWKKYVPEALAAGKFLARPEPLVIKGGLDKVQEAMDRLKQGVSAAKVVVEL